MSDKEGNQTEGVLMKLHDLMDETDQLIGCVTNLITEMEEQDADIQVGEDCLEYVKTLKSRVRMCMRQMRKNFDGMETASCSSKNEKRSTEESARSFSNTSQSTSRGTLTKESSKQISTGRSLSKCHQPTTQG